MAGQYLRAPPGASSRERQLGQLEIGRGSYNKLDWSNFAEKMNELAYGD